MADRAMNDGRLQNIRDAVADGTANIDDARELLAALTELRLLWEALNAERSIWYATADRTKADLAETRAQLDAVRVELGAERAARLAAEQREGSSIAWREGRAAGLREARAALERLPEPSDQPEPDPAS